MCDKCQTFLGTNFIFILRPFFIAQFLIGLIAVGEEWEERERMITRSHNDMISQGGKDRVAALLWAASSQNPTRPDF